MTSAPALNLALSVPQPNAGLPQGGGEGSDEAFGELLEATFLSSLAELKQNMGGRSRLEDAPQREAEAGSPRTRDADAVASVEQAVAPSVTSPMVLASLQAAAGLSAAPAEASLLPAPPIDDVRVPQTIDPALPEGDAPVMPGQVQEPIDAFDAARLLKVLSPEEPPALLAAASQAGHEIVADTTMRVLRKETHLAVVRSPGGELAGQLGTLGADAVADAPVAGELSHHAGGEPQQEQGERDAKSPTVNAIALSSDGVRQTTAMVPDIEAPFDSPGEQIFTTVRSELEARSAGETTTSDGPLKVLHLELKPAHLGSVTVRIALRDNVVTLHLEAHRSETLSAIERDRDALAGALASAGYSVEAITSALPSDTGRLPGIAAGSADGSSSAAQGGGQGSFGQAAGNGGANSAGQGRSGHSSRDRAGEQPGAGNTDTGRMARSTSDGLYV